jgi:hypothetical protein
LVALVDLAVRVCAFVVHEPPGSAFDVAAFGELLEKFANRTPVFCRLEPDTPDVKRGLSSDWRFTGPPIRPVPAKRGSTNAAHALL